MNKWRPHWDWALVVVLGAALGLIGVPMIDAMREAAEQKQQVSAQQAARVQSEYAALASDAAAAEKLRVELGPEAWKKLLAPPPRAQLVAALRQFGVEGGLHDLDLTLGSATLTVEPAVGAEPWPLTVSAIAMKLSAASDQQIFAFVRRAMKELPGDIRLEHLMLQRQSGKNPVTASVALRWLAFAEEPAMARVQP